MEYNIQDLAVIASQINYNPALSVAVGRALSAVDLVAYNIAIKKATKIAIGYDNVEIEDPKDYGKSSYLPGMPLWQPVLLKGFDGGEDLLLENAVVELNRTKNIVTTQVQGRETSVDEFINNGDWNITISGLLVSRENRKYPIEEVRDFQIFMDRNEPIGVQNELLNELGIFDILVLTQSLPRTPHWNVQIYSFTAKQSLPWPLIIDDLN